MTEVEYKNSLVELKEIFKILDKKLIEKLPESFLNLIKSVNSDTYNFELDSSKSLSEQKLSETTELFLTTLNLKYWCNDEEKQEILTAMRINEEKYQEELREKYNPENIIKKETKVEEVKQEEVQQPETATIQEEPKVEQVQMVEYKKKGFFSRLIDKIKNFFKK